MKPSSDIVAEYSILPTFDLRRGNVVDVEIGAQRGQLLSSRGAETPMLSRGSSNASAELDES
jgi:hypothetical protein